MLLNEGQSAALETFRAGLSDEEGQMKKKSPENVCPVCGGGMHPGTTTFTADLGFSVVVIRNVPATVCSQCGSDWIPDNIASRIEGLVAEARFKRSQVEVVALS